jgi:hypothetical protein
MVRPQSMLSLAAFKSSSELYGSHFMVAKYTDVSVSFLEVRHSFANESLSTYLALVRHQRPQLVHVMEL